MRTKAVFKHAYNQLLNEIGALPTGAELGSEPELARILRVSRTTVRAAVVEATSRNLLQIGPRRRLTLRKPRADDYFASAETETVPQSSERLFLNHVLKGGLLPGETINGLALSRALGTSPTGLRDYLSRFERFGLVERQPNTSWIFRGFTEEFAIELFVIRELFELHAVRIFFQNRGRSELRALDRIEAKHRTLLATIDDDFHQFSELDAEFHREITRSAKNRFIDQFQEIISLIFHYHYHWHKADERDRNCAAIHEHLAIIEALRCDSCLDVVAACQRHLNSAKQTLLRSINRGKMLSSPTRPLRT